MWLITRWRERTAHDTLYTPSGIDEVHDEAVGVTSAESALMTVLIDHGGPGADALVRWLVTGEHVVGNGVSTVDRGWPLPATPDSWV